MVMSIEDEAYGLLPYCNVCLGLTDHDYQTYNIAVSGVLLAVVGLVGMVGNCIVIVVYTRPEQRVLSTSIYLAALAFSDFFMICTAMFLFVLEAWRHHGPPSLAKAYALGAPLIFPLGAVFQTTSVYFCVAAAVDCFISVVLPKQLSEICCTAKKARTVVWTLAICCTIYNIPHFFEIHAIECIDPKHGNALSLQICPTDIRMDALYYTIYYTYMYTTFMAVGPLLLLIVLNCFVVANVLRKGASEDSDTVSLILVVCLFIFCNFTALLVNFLEQALYEQLKHVIVYLVDLSNLLVVINCTANFFVYLIFGNSFRRTLVALLHCNKLATHSSLSSATKAAQREITTRAQSPDHRFSANTKRGKLEDQDFARNYGRSSRRISLASPQSANNAYAFVGPRPPLAEEEQLVADDTEPIVSCTHSNTTTKLQRGKNEKETVENGRNNDNNGMGTIISIFDPASLSQVITVL